jgi:hypothetical protein
MTGLLRLNENQSNEFISMNQILNTFLGRDCQATSNKQET